MPNLAAFHAKLNEIKKMNFYFALKVSFSIAWIQNCCGYWFSFYPIFMALNTNKPNTRQSIFRITIALKCTYIISVFSTSLTSQHVFLLSTKVQYHNGL